MSSAGAYTNVVFQESTAMTQGLGNGRNCPPCQLAAPPLPVRLRPLGRAFTQLVDVTVMTLPRSGQKDGLLGSTHCSASGIR